jgi:hypothetical protein
LCSWWSGTKEEREVQKTGTALVLIILGLVVVAFPVLGLVSASIIYGFIILLLGIGLIVAGLWEMEESAGLGIVELVLGIIALILGIGCIFNPDLFSRASCLSSPVSSGSSRRPAGTGGTGSQASRSASSSWPSASSSRFPRSSES